jgi:hypothetical protein
MFWANLTPFSLQRPWRPVVGSSSATVRDHLGRSSALSVFHSKFDLYGGFDWARRVLNGPKRRFPAWADVESNAHELAKAIATDLQQECPALQDRGLILQELDTDIGSGIDESRTVVVYLTRGAVTATEPGYHGLARTTEVLTKARDRQCLLVCSTLSRQTQTVTLL